MGLSFSNLSASCQSEKGYQKLDSAGLFSRSTSAYLSLEFHYVTHLLSNLRVCHLPHVSCLSDEACAHRAHIDRYLLTESPSSRCSFSVCATPFKLCIIIICMLIDCHLHQFLSWIQKGFRILQQVHLVNELKRQVVDVRLCLLAISLTKCRLDNIRKDVLHYFPNPFFVVFTHLQ